ncbi:hypothetical protein [Pararhodobacter sp.]|uniref:hypothetical protein n=1 Tax=Pararhodobacter sp. TaxID=2127056 RepID=UPI002AFEB9CE|nr:hypothetical protein [Pararhodobacter sp.]
MNANKISYTQLLETNNLIQTHADESYWLCVTRTVQESKLFPVPAYMMMSYLMAYYRYPALFRKIESKMSAEEIGDRARNMGMKIQNPGMSYMPDFYLLGREWLINMGIIRPTDGIEDLIYVMDFSKRFQLAYHRNDAHISNREFGHRSQILPERRIQVYHADMYDCTAGDELHVAAHGFMAAASQYGFLISCESRISLHNHGPYKLDDGVEMIVRDFMDMAESDFPWLDDAAEGVEYNNITVTMAVKDAHFYLVDDWGSFESKPEFSAEKLVGVGLYYSDNLSDGHQPLGMESREELIETFKRLTEQARTATNKLWMKIAGWSRDQMIDAGAITYFAICKDLAHVAGVYDPEDWMKVDERAERFRPLLNDEYSRDVLGELCVALNPSQKLQEYAMMQHANKNARLYQLIPYSILDGEPYTATVGEVFPGITYLDAKKDVYTTTKGKIGFEEYNRLSQEAVPNNASGKYRYLCDTWLKYNYQSPLADELYKAEQRNSRRLKDKGAALTRDDIAALRQ